MYKSNSTIICLFQYIYSQQISLLKSLKLQKSSLLDRTLAFSLVSVKYIHNYTCLFHH